MKRILVNVESLPTGLRMMPVIKTLLADGRHDITTFSTLTNAGPHPDSINVLVNFFRSHDIPIVTLPPNIRNAPEINGIAQAYTHRFNQALEDVFQSRGPVYKSVPLLKYAASMMLQDNLYKINNMYWFENVLDHFRPDLVVNGYDFGGIKRHFTVVAKTRGIPTLSLQYGGGWTKLRSQRIADYFCVWGEKFRTLHLDAGYDPERVVVTGSPHIDWHVSEPFSKNRMLSNLNLDPDKKTIFFGIAAEDPTEFIQAVLDVATGQNRIQVIFKLHPECTVEARKKYETMVHQKAAGRSVIIQHEVLDAADLIKCSDVVVSAFSNVVLEGLALKRDLILMCPEDTYQTDDQGRLTPAPQNADQYTLPARSGRELIGHLNRVIDQPGLTADTESAARHRQQLYFKVDGLASRRTVDVMEKILAEQDRTSAADQLRFGSQR